MKYWEFLIQKEGDDTWLPLETQQVEILEGRYRVVAHTDRLNTPMEIQVSQLDTSQMPPRKRVRKRTSETNDAGLVVVMPYVHLKPGQWDLSCRSVNSAGDSTGDTWQYQVQLQVFAPTDEDWSSEWPVPEDSPGAHSSLIEAEASDVPPSNQDTPLLQAQAQLQNNLQRQGQASTEDTSLLNSVYQVSLRQQAFLARRNQAMTIMGQVQALSDALPAQGASQLWLRLQNPETAKVIMEAHRPLSLERLPADFKVKIQLPANVKTRVVLGEVSLRTVPIEGEPSKLLTSTGFTITAGIAQLIDDIANRDPGTFEEELAALSGHASMQAAAPIEGGLNAEPDLISPILDPTRQAVMPAVGVVLPPQLNQDLGSDLDPSVSQPSEPAAEQPELPTFPRVSQPGSEQHLDHHQPLSVNDAPSHGSNNGTNNGTSSDSMPPVEQDFPRRQSLVAQPAQFMGTSIEDDDLEASQIAALLEDIDGDLASQPADIDSLEPPGVEGMLEAAPDSAIALPGDNRRNVVPHSQDNEAAGNSDWRSHSTNQPAPNQPAPADERTQRQNAASKAFKSLKLKDHFWQRLSNLTHESREEAAQLAENMEAAGVTPRSERPSDSRSLPPFPVAQQDSLPANSEVVIYDQPSGVPQTDANPDVPQRDSAPVGQPTAAQSSAAFPAAQDIPLSPDSVGSSASSSARPSTASQGTFTSASYATSDSSPLGPSSVGPSSLGHSQFQSQASGDDLPEMELPVISVPRGDFVAGDTVTVTVRSRPSVYKPFIKLWMIDRQSRTLVGEPKLLTNLKSDALGYLEASAELRVPMGCLDVQIAAIAVDMATQQESNKAIVNRHVVPANQSLPPLRNFNL